MSRADYKRRVVAIYEKYAPAKVSTADSALDKYQGQEDALIEVLVNRYGPEPYSAPAVVPNSSSVRINTQQPVAVVGGGGGGGAVQPFHEPGPPPRQGSMYGTTDETSGFFSPLQQQPSGANYGDQMMRTPTQHQQQHPQSMFNNSLGGDGSPQPQAFSPHQQGQGSMTPGFSSVVSQHRQPPPQEEVDEFAEVRKIGRETQFASSEHERMWEEAWMGKIPLATVQKYVGGGQAALMEGWGHKTLSRPKIAFMRKFVKRYFLLLPFFLYYFEKDDEKSQCRGALYMEGAMVGEVEVEGKTCIEITSRVNHKPAQLDPNGNYSGFKIYFDSSRSQTRWLQILQEMTKVKPRAKSQQPNNTPQQQWSSQPSQHQQQSQQQQLSGNGTPANSHHGGGTPLQMPPLTPVVPPTPGGSQLARSPTPTQGGGEGPNSASAATPNNTTTAATPPANLADHSTTPPPTGSILVSEDNVKNRIRRLSKQQKNDPMAVIEKLTEFICKQRGVGDQQQLWGLMEDLETINDEAVATQRVENSVVAELKVQAEAMRKKIDDQNEMISQLGGHPIGGGGTTAVAAAADVSTGSVAATANTSIATNRSPVRVIHGDSAWQDRMSRIQARKNLVDQMLNDLPTSS